MSRAQPITVEDLLPLTPPVFHILLSLIDGARHGYAIMHDVADQTNGALTLGPGTLYGCLKRMTESGLVVESDARPEAGNDDDRRRYYQMTALGRRVVGAEAERLVHAVEAARGRGVLGSAGARA
jgi:DNA-binding PadR family transcriptional regulator